MPLKTVKKKNDVQINSIMYLFFLLLFFLLSLLHTSLSLTLLCDNLSLPSLPSCASYITCDSPLMISWKL